MAAEQKQTRSNILSVLAIVFVPTAGGIWWAGGAASIITDLVSSQAKQDARIDRIASDVSAHVAVDAGTRSQVEAMDSHLNRIENAIHDNSKLLEDLLGKIASQQGMMSRATGGP